MVSEFDSTLYNPMNAMNLNFNYGLGFGNGYMGGFDGNISNPIDHQYDTLRNKTNLAQLNNDEFFRRVEKEKLKFSIKDIGIMVLTGAIGLWGLKKGLGLAFKKAPPKPTAPSK